MIGTGQVYKGSVWHNSWPLVSKGALPNRWKDYQANGAGHLTCLPACTRVSTDGKAIRPLEQAI
eukprot:scaffold103631_cov22-Tisochrysis_lutea.AAC.1